MERTGRKKKVCHQRCVFSVSVLDQTMKQCFCLFSTFITYTRMQRMNPIPFFSIFFFLFISIAFPLCVTRIPSFNRRTNRQNNNSLKRRERKMLFCYFPLLLPMIIQLSSVWSSQWMSKCNGEWRAFEQ